MVYIHRQAINVRKCIGWICVLLFVFICTVCFMPSTPAHAQIITTDCETTMIYQPGVGWIAGSEITTCTTETTNISDGSQFAEMMKNSCGTGNPCPTAPPDTDDGLTEERKCMVAQAAESAIDQKARQITSDIKNKRDWKKREYGAVIIRNSAGELRVTRLFRGTGLGSSVNFEFTMRTGDTIVGAVHNHTQSNYNNATGPSEHDWRVARDWVNSGLAGAGTYSEYIVSTEGTLAEFDYDKDYGRNSANGSHRKDAQSKC